MTELLHDKSGNPVTRRAVLQTGAAAAAFVAMAGPLQAQDSEAPVVLITGTSTGFGRLMAEGFARKGARVIATMREVEGKNAEAAAELRDLASDDGLAIEVVEIDVTSEVSVAAGVARAAESAGRIDVLVNNAGIVVPGPTELQPIHYFHANIDTNAGGAMRMSKAVVPHMRARGQGTIIQMSSALGRAIDPMLGGYCASKLVAEAAADALSHELAASNIEVSIVQPAAPYPTRLQTNAARYWEEMLADLNATERALLETYAPHIENMLSELTPNEEIDPKEVSDAVIALAAMEFSTRPGRLAVGLYKDGIEPVNAAHDALQRDLVSHSAIAQLVTPI